MCVHKIREIKGPIHNARYFINSTRNHVILLDLVTASVFDKIYKIDMQKLILFYRRASKALVCWSEGFFLSPFSVKLWIQIPPLPEGTKNESHLRTFPLTSLSEHRCE